MIPINDALDKLSPELFMEKQEGYEEWFIAKVTSSLDAVKAGTAVLTDHDVAMDRVWDRAQARTLILLRKPIR